MNYEKAGENDGAKTSAPERGQHAEANDGKGQCAGGLLERLKGVDNLVVAYNSLQSEFTRRSQKLRELERENAALKEKDNSARKSLSDYAAGEEDFIREYVPELKDEISLLKDIADKKGDDKEWRLVRAIRELAKTKAEASEQKYNSEEYLLSALQANPDLKKGIIRAYLKEIGSATPAVNLITGNGTANITPPASPKTFAEANEIARRILEKNKE